MKGIRVNPKKRTVRAEAGCLLQDVDRETSLHGLVMPAGTKLACFTYNTTEQQLRMMINTPHFFRCCWPHWAFRTGSWRRNWMAL